MICRTKKKKKQKKISTSKKRTELTEINLQKIASVGIVQGHKLFEV